MRSHLSTIVLPLRSCLLGLWLCALGVGCTVSPLPDPPSLRPVEITVVTVEPGCLNPACDGGFHLEGGPGAAEPGTILWAVNLDSPFDPVTSVVAEDGSFEVEGRATLGDELRLQLRRDGERSEPVDVRTVAVGSSVAPADRPLSDCFVARPALELDLGSTTVGEPITMAITLDNGCAAPVVVDAVNLRAPSDAFVVRTGPMMITAGSTAAVDIELSPISAATFEEVVLIEIASPERDRRPITLRGIGTD